jgi:hypothetical protein
MAIYSPTGKRCVIVAREHEGEMLYEETLTVRYSDDEPCSQWMVSELRADDGLREIQIAVDSLWREPRESRF